MANGTMYFRVQSIPIYPRCSERASNSGRGDLPAIVTMLKGSRDASQDATVMKLRLHKTALTSKKLSGNRVITGPYCRL